MSFPAVSPSISNSEVTPIIKGVFFDNHWRWAVVKKNRLIALFINEMDAWDYNYSVVKVKADATYQEPA